MPHQHKCARFVQLNAGHCAAGRVVLGSRSRGSSQKGRIFTFKLFPHTSHGIQEVCLQPADGELAQLGFSPGRDTFTWALDTNTHKHSTGCRVSKDTRTYNRCWPFALLCWNLMSRIFHLEYRKEPRHMCFTLRWNSTDIENHRISITLLILFYDFMANPCTRGNSTPFKAEWLPPNNNARTSPSATNSTVAKQPQSVTDGTYKRGPCVHSPEFWSTYTPSPTQSVSGRWRRRLQKITRISPQNGTSFPRFPPSQPGLGHRLVSVVVGRGECLYAIDRRADDDDDANTYSTQPGSSCISVAFAWS